MKMKLKSNRSMSFSVIYWIICLVMVVTAFKSEYTSGSDDPIYAGEIDISADYGTEGFDIPNMELGRGVYALTLAYDTNGFANVSFESDAAAGDVGYSETLLTPYNGYAEPYIYVYRDGAHISGKIRTNNPDTSLHLMMVSLRRMRKLSATYTALRLIAMMLLLYAVILIIKRGGRTASVTVNRWVPEILTVWVISMAGFIPGILGRYIAGGHDIEAHMGRIAAIADGLGTRVFPVRIYRFFANDYGYPMGIFYGDILLYPEAVLHRLGLPLWQCYIVFVALISLLTALVSYFCFKEISRDDRAAMLATAAYMLAPWRLNDIYVRAAAGEYAAMAFLPLIALGFITVMTADKDDKKGLKHSVLWLILGFTGLIHTHMITCVMAAVFAAIYCLIYIKRLITERRILHIAIAAILTVLLNLSFIVPFADMYLRNDYIVKHLSGGIDVHGAYLRQLLSFTGDYTEVSYPVGEVADLTGEMPITAGLLLPLILFAIIVCAFRSDRKTGSGQIRTGKSDGIIIAAFTVFASFLATKYFPYRVIADNKIPILTILTKVQFPWRYLVIVTLMISLGILYVCGRLVKEDGTDADSEESPADVNESSDKGVKLSPRRIFTAAVLILTVIQAAVFMYRQNTADNKHVNAGNVYPIVTALMDSDIMYLPEGMDPEILKDRTIQTSSGDITVQDMGYDGKEYTIGVNSASDKDEWITLPLIYYPGYKASDGSSVTESEDHRVKLMVPAEYGDMVTVGFKEPLYWRLAEMITCVMAIVIIVVLIREQRNKGTEN